MARKKNQSGEHYSQMDKIDRKIQKQKLHEVKEKKKSNQIRFEEDDDEDDYRDILSEAYDDIDISDYDDDAGYMDDLFNWNERYSE